MVDRNVSSFVSILQNPKTKRLKISFCYSFFWILDTLMALMLRATTAITFPLKLCPSCTKIPLNHKKSMASFATEANLQTTTTDRKLPILLFDIMDTIVRDPFYHDVAPFFGMSFEELLESKHPTAWTEFEEGIIDEMELYKKFFKDGRPFDLQGLKNCMRRGYSYIDGVEQLLYDLKQKNYEMHAFTNYPIWYKMIEEELNISTYLSWTFCSCISGKRKPDLDSYLVVLRHLNVDPISCIFVDDRLRNVEGATEVGIIGLHFKNAETLRRDLSRVGIDISTDEHNKRND
ncbi:flavin mononucleotide hydrolase 1, chloroplatic isoform X3 [Jatropha curcas]|nr:flavin mononucleotide hydrolase 1, chloroplatic isoform X3 [Jatropha curcas]